MKRQKEKDDIDIISNDDVSERFEQVKELLESKIAALEKRVDSLHQKRSTKKATRGRPKKKVEERASERVIFRLKPEESVQLLSLAEPGESIGQTARRILMNAILSQEENNKTA